ncbi:MAG: zf-HC2 domain-containing protein [Gemmatimonadales bacterium]
MMNDCPNGTMRDLLPAFVHGVLADADRAAVAAHVAGCEECAAEIELIRTASRAFAAPEIDVGRIVGALPRAPRRRAQPTFAGRAQRVAAAIAIVAIGAYSVVTIRDSRRTGVRPAASPPGSNAGTTPVAAAPPRVTAPVIDSPAHEAPRPASAVPSRPAMSFGGGLSDLSDEQLDTLLGELDDLDALPSVEPETHLTPILPPADGGHGVR